MVTDEQRIEALEERVSVFFEAFHILLWDYHSKNHKDDANTGGYMACIEWPCLQFALKIWKHE